MLRTKLEVLLDKMHLVLEESEDELSKVDIRLLSKYNDQVRLLLREQESSGNVHSTPKDKDEEEPVKARAEELAAEAPQAEEVKKDPEAKEETNGAKEEENAKEESEAKKTRIQPLEERQASQPSRSFSFLDEQQGKDENEEVEQEAPETPQEEDQYKEIYENLEKVRKQREISRSFSQDEEEDEETDSGEESSLNDRFRQHEADLVDHLKEKPIGSLQTEIDLNDKFWFINELFEGDAATFNRLLRELDSLHSYEDAKEKINEMGRIKYEWEAENPAVDKFHRVVRRRYL